MICESEISMKYTSLLLVTALAACGSCAHPFAAREVVHPDTESRPAVMLLRTHDAKGEELGHCTAWKVDDDLIATAGHCCTKGENYTIENMDGTAGMTPTVVFDAYDEENDEGTDMCFLKASVPGAAIELADRDPHNGARVWSEGFPHEYRLISEGFWSGRNTEYGVCSVVVNPGASGSPILDVQNRAVGILVRFHRGMDNLTLVTPIEKVRMGLTHAQNLLKIGKVDEPDPKEAEEFDIIFNLGLDLD